MRKEEAVIAAVVVVVVVGRSVGRSFPVLDRVSASLESAGHLTRGQFTLPSKIRQAIIFVRDGEGGEGVGGREGEEARA